MTIWIQCLPHIRREVHLTSISSHHVTLEDLLLVQSESVLRSKDQDLIIHGLTGQPLSWGGSKWQGWLECLKRKSDKTSAKSIIMSRVSPRLLLIRRSAHLKRTPPQFISQRSDVVICTNRTPTRIRWIFKMNSLFALRNTQHPSRMLSTCTQNSTYWERKWNCGTFPTSSHYSIHDVCHWCCQTPTRVRIEAIHTNASAL